MTSVGVLHLVLALLAAAILLSLTADKLGLPSAVPLVIGGIALALMPGSPALDLDPAIILELFLPPLLLNAAYFTVWRDFRAEARPIVLLSLGAVVFTTLSVGCVARMIVPTLPWATCFALGAIVSPPDAVSARAIFQRIPIPRRLQTILEGESLVNDAAALVLYRFAVAAALSGTFNIFDAAASFAWLAIGGIGFGLILGGITDVLLRRLRDPRYIIITTLLAAYAAFIGAEHLHASGVLAVVSCGLLIGWRQHEVLGAEVRSQYNAVWGLIVFILEALVFVLIGLSLHAILDRMSGTAHAAEIGLPLALASAGAVLVARFAWIFASHHLQRIPVPFLRDSLPVTANGTLIIMSWTGMRGVVSLAAALALPAAFPGRDSVIFATFIVILVTVVGQGLTLRPLIKRIPLSDEGTLDATLSFSEVRVKVNVASLEALETLVDPDDGTPAHPELVDDYRNRTRATERLRDEDETIGEESRAHFKAALQAVEKGRGELLRLLHQGDVHETVVHRIEAELDLEEIRLRKLVEAVASDTPNKEPSADAEKTPASPKSHDLP